MSLKDWLNTTNLLILSGDSILLVGFISINKDFTFVSLSLIIIGYLLIYIAVRKTV